MLRTLLIVGISAVVVSLHPPVAAAQQPKPVRVGGTIERIDGAVLTVKATDGHEQRVRLSEHASVTGVAKATLGDIKPNSFIGVGAAPQPDGSQRAIRVVIFAEAQRGLGEGHRPWDRPNTTMTNGAVDTKVASVEGDVLHVKYKGGEQKIVVPPDAIILANAVSDRSELKPGAHVAIVRAAPQPDGTFQADRISVGRGGVVP
jgi:hypothetical protein